MYNYLKFFNQILFEKSLKFLRVQAGESPTLETVLY